MKYTLIADNVFDGEQFLGSVPVNIEDGRVLALSGEARFAETRLQGTLVPGFVDVQVNGGGGVLFNSQTDRHGIEAIVRAHSQYGTTGMLPTLITDDVEVMARAADAMADALAHNSPGVLGIHFEGPHLSVPKKGVHPQGHIRRISDAELEIFCRNDLGVRVITLAPENVSADVIKALVSTGARVCLGHTNADYDTVMAAIEAGASGFTHLYNAMSALGSREPGVVGAAIDDENTWCGLIVDGHHVHAAAARIAIKAKPRGKVMLVTDAMPPVGVPEGESFELFGTQVVRHGDRLNAVTGELAGCVLDMATAVRNTVYQLKQTQQEALRMASLYPAQYLGLDAELGKIAEGYRADFALLDEGLVNRASYIGGHRVY